MTWIGIGTGRCGTQSLASIFSVAHEPQLHAWNETHRSMREFWRFRAQDQVNFSLARHIGVLREVDPQLKVVCLYRETEATVRSHLRVNRIGPNRLWYPRFPEAQTSEDAWRLYIKFVHGLMDNIQPPVYRIEMEQLNDDEMLKDLWVWLKGNPPKRLPAIRYVDIKNLPSSEALERFK